MVEGGGVRDSNSKLFQRLAVAYRRRNHIESVEMWGGGNRGAIVVFMNVYLRRN